MEVFFLILVAIVFIILREFWTWYFKLNTITKQNEEIIKLLRKIAGEPEPKTTSEKKSTKASEINSK